MFLRHHVCEVLVPLKSDKSSPFWLLIGAPSSAPPRSKASLSTWIRLLPPSLLAPPSPLLQRITDGLTDCSPLPGPAHGIGSRCPPGTWLRGAGAVNGELTSDRGTVDDGRWARFSPEAKRRRDGRRADEHPCSAWLALHIHTGSPYC